MAQEILVNNYKQYYEKLKTYFGEESADKLIDLAGGVDRVMNAPFAHMQDSGLAKPGALITATFDIVKLALKLASLLPENKTLPKDSIVKVGLLQNLSKSLLFVDSESWQKKNGQLYAFEKNLPGALRTGERSICIATQAGIPFSPEEFEAMRVMDKDSSADNFTRFFSSPLAVIIRQANEHVDMRYRIA